MEGIDYIIGEAPFESIAGFFKTLVNEYNQALQHDMDGESPLPFDPSKTIAFFEAELGIDNDDDSHGPLTNMIVEGLNDGIDMKYKFKDIDEISNIYMEAVYQKIRWLLNGLETEAEKLDFLDRADSILSASPLVEEYKQRFQKKHV